MTDPLILPPNGEGLVWKFLSEQAELGTLVGGTGNAARIYSTLPDGVTFPAMRVHLYDSVNVTQRPLWCWDQYLQLEAWGGSKADAHRILGTAVAAMSQRLIDWTHPDYAAAVTAVRFQGWRDMPDDTYAPARPRWLVTAIVSAHPVL